MSDPKPVHKAVHTVTHLGHTSNPLVAIEVAGRVCYKSEDKITPDSALRFVTGLVRRGHESVLEHVSFSFRVITDRGCCYTPGTLVLTEAGWLPIEGVSDGIKVFTLTDNNEMILIKPSKKIKIHHSGKIHEFKTTQVSLQVTPNHNMWVFDYDKRAKETRVWKFIKAGDIKNKRYRFYKSCLNYIGNENKEIVLPKTIKHPALPIKASNVLPFLHLIGLWCTDGSLSAGKDGAGNRCVITQTKSKIRAIIEGLLNKLCLPYTKYDTEFRINCPPLYKWLLQTFIHGHNMRKSYYISTPRFIANSGKCEIETFLQGVIEGNGHSAKDGRILISTASESFARDLTELFAKIGKSANYYPNGKPGRSHIGPGGKCVVAKVQAYTVSVIREQMPLVCRGSGWKTFVYDGPVYCLELPKHHRLYVMRDGKPSWCGNSHELVRHRIGVAFSQESTRYCNYGKDKFGGITVIDNPRISEEAQHRRDTLWRAIEKVYLAEIAEGITPQDARDVLPNALKTEIIVTANAREWRHILRLRTSPAAHPSIRGVMAQVFAWFRQHYPVLVEDLTAPEGQVALVLDDPLMPKEV